MSPVRILRSHIPVWPMAVLIALTVSASPVADVSQAWAATWPDEFRAGQFFYHADFSLKNHREFLANIPRQYQEVAKALQIEPSDEVIHVFLFRYKSTYQRYLRQYFPDVPARKALYIKSRQQSPGMVFAYLGEGFETDIRHECTHAMLNAALPMVPLWLDEGLAEYFEVPADERAGSNGHQSFVQWSARFGQAPPLEELESINDLSQMTRSRYRHAWAWVHFMLHGPAPAREELVKYLADIQSYNPPGRLSRRLKTRLPDLERQFIEHFRNWQP